MELPHELLLDLPPTTRPGTFDVNGIDWRLTKGRFRPTTYNFKLKVGMGLTLSDLPRVGALFKMTRLRRPPAMTVHIGGVAFSTRPIGYQGDKGTLFYAGTGRTEWYWMNEYGFHRFLGTLFDFAREHSTAPVVAKKKAKKKKKGWSGARGWVR